MQYRDNKQIVIDALKAEIKRIDAKIKKHEREPFEAISNRYSDLMEQVQDALNEKLRETDNDAFIALLEKGRKAEADYHAALSSVASDDYEKLAYLKRERALVQALITNANRGVLYL